MQRARVCVCVCVRTCMVVCMHVWAFFLGWGSVVFVIPRRTMTLGKRKVRNHHVKGKHSCPYLYIGFL